MGYFYIDESVHDEAGFIIAACVYSDKDLNDSIMDIITFHGFNPNDFEYKSSTNYSKEPEKAKVRGKLKEIMVNYCKLGIVVVPRTSRKLLGYECIKAIMQFLNFNRTIKSPLIIYFDQGMFTSIKETSAFIESLNFTDCVFHLEQDSRKIRGIQLADLSAHITSIQLKETLGFVTKKIKAGENSGYDPDLEIELGFEMFATLRYSLFNEGSKDYQDVPVGDNTFKVEPYGLYVSTLCDNILAEKVRQTFSYVYLGCIH